MSSKPAYLTLGAALGLIVAGSITAAPVVTLDRTAFTYQWDFDGADTAENYDRYNSTTGVAVGDGTNEWSPAPTPAGGVISGPTNGSLVNTFWTTSTAAAAQLTATTGYTVEHRVRFNTTGALLVEATVNGNGTPGTTAAVTGIANATDPTLLDLYFDLGTPGQDLSTSVANNEFFTLRIAATPDATKSGGLSYSVYVDDVLVGDDLDAERTSLTTRRFFVGDIGGVTEGIASLEYTAFTAGAFAPVPEPGTLALIGLGVLSLAARRRHAE